MNTWLTSHGVRARRQLIDALRLNALIAPLRTAGEDVSGSEKCLSLAEYQRAGPRRFGLTVWQVLDHAIAKRIAVNWATGDPLSALRFSLDALNGLRPRTRQQAMDFAKVGQKLRVHPEIVRRLSHAGMLESTWSRCADGHWRHLVAPTTLAAFQQRYVFGSTLARRYRQHAASFTDKLAHFGVKPVSGPTIDGGLTFVYERDEVDKVNLQDVAACQTYKSSSGRPRLSDTTRHKISAWAVCGFVGYGEAARLLRVSKRQLSSLVDQCLIRSRKHPNPFEDARMFLKRDLMALKATLRD